MSAWWGATKDSGTRDGELQLSIQNGVIVHITSGWKLNFNSGRRAACSRAPACVMGIQLYINLVSGPRLDF
jgi:hypothetical protein